MRLISTLGWTAKVVIETAKVLKPDENVVIYGYVDENEEMEIKKALDKVREELNNVIEVHVRDPMNFYECIQAVDRYLTEDSVANITGGTKIMAFSLALRAAVLGVPVVYMATENGETKILRLPINLITDSNSLIRIHDKDSTTMKFLTTLVEKYGGKASMKDIKRALGSRYSTLSDAKNKLIKANLINEFKNGREKIIIANNAAYLFLGGNAQ